MRRTQTTTWWIVPVIIITVPLILCAQHSPVHIPPMFSSALKKSLDPTKELSHYIHTVWQIEQGLPQNSAQALCQTRDGYLWIGTEEGLVRFDGVRFTVFDKHNTSQLGANSIQTLIEDMTGALWIGTNGGGLCRYHNGAFTAFTTKQGLCNNFVRSLVEDRSNGPNRGAIWIGTFGGGVCRYQNGTFVTYSTANGLSHNLVFSMLQDNEGAIWIGTNGGGVNRIQNGVLSYYSTANGLSSNLVRILLQDREGSIWIGTFGGGLNRLKDGKITTMTTRDGLAHNLIWSLLEDRAGALWIGTFGGGINRLYKGKISTFTTKNNLSSDLVRSLLEDAEGNMWIGTVGGLNRLKDGKFETFTTKDGLPHDVVRALLEDRTTIPEGQSALPQKNLWVGTFGGGVAKLGGNPIVYTSKNGLSTSIIYSLWQDNTFGTNKGALWIGTNGGGLNYVHRGKTRVYTEKDGLANDVVFCLTQDPEGTLWIGTGNGLSSFANGRFTTYTMQNGLTHDDIRVLLVDRSGALWIGTVGGGLNCLKNGVFTAITTANGLANNNIRSLYEDKDGTLWIGTVGGGLHRLKNGRIAVFSARDGLFDDVAHTILEDDFGNLWMSSNKGIYRINKQDLHAFADGVLKTLSCEVYGTADGMKSAECNSGSPAAIKDQTGNLWFATMQGAVTIDPRLAHQPQNPIKPAVIIEQVFADTLPLNLAAPLLLTPQYQKFEFLFTSTSLSSPERVKFKFLLEGYDKQWVDAGTRRFAYYTNLPRGRQYRFRVVACSSYGMWNETGASVMFYIQPFFWETWWFYSFCSMGVVFVSLGLIRYRIRHLRNRAQELETMIELRTAQLRESNEEIQRHIDLLDDQARKITIVNDELKVKNLQLETLHLEKDEFLGIAAHDLKNPLASIALTARLIRLYQGRHGAEWVEDQAQKIEQMTERMMAIIGNLLDVNALESGVLQYRLENIRILPVVSAVIQEHQPIAQQKKIHLYAIPPPDTTLEVYADKQIVVEILENLISNAIKYSPPESSVRITITSSLPNGSPEMPAIVHISVYDEGPGLSAEDQAKLFGKFMKLSAKPTAGEHSTGLGLFIAKKLAEIMNGSIRCESEPGKGSCFTVDLPGALAPQKQIETHQ